MGKGREGKKGVSEAWDALHRLGSLSSIHTYTHIHTQSICHGLMLVDLWIWQRERLQHCSNPHSSVSTDLQTGLTIAEAYCNTSGQ